MIALRFFLLLAFRVVKYLWLTLWTLYQIALGALLVLIAVFAFKVADYFHVGEMRALRHSPPVTTAFIDSERQGLRDSLVAAKRRGAKVLPDTAIHWAWTPLDSLPKTLVELTLIAEDAKFYSHQGFDLEEIEYALVANHQAGRQARGASTITQQVAKNLFLSGDRDMRRKLREAVIVLELEQCLTKDRILEIYLNIAQFGHGIFGVLEAARQRFGKEPAQLTQDEMLSLVCLLPAPDRWNPKKPAPAYLAHKRLVLRNYAMFKGIKSMGDSTAPDWLRNAYDSLGGFLNDQRWKGLRSAPASTWSDSAGNDSSRPEDSRLESGPESRRLF